MNDIKKIGSGTFNLANPVSILNYSTIVGEKEKNGPLGSYFPLYSDDEYFGQDSFEKAETFMQKEVLNHVIQKSGFSANDVDFIFAGDLLNQCIGSNYSVRDIDVQFFGLYGACSTMAEAMILASMVIDGGFANKAVALTSSHFCSAERQFRFPLEYGSQRPPSAQWTVTGAGCVLLGKAANKPRIVQFCPGTICDMGIKDIGNMGAAMAPSAALTLKMFFTDTKTSPDDYDLILSGDLGSIGHELTIKLLQKEGIKLSENFKDCGMLIFDAERQDVHAGGSGCGCSASVLAGYILPEMENYKFKNILFVATGALMSPTTTLQGETIPGIAHLLHIVA